MHLNSNLLSTFESLMRNFECEWVNKGRVSDDWKVKIFQRVSDGKQIALYDRKNEFLVRLEHSPAALAGIRVLSNCPASSALKLGKSKFKTGIGVCVIVPDIANLKKLLEDYFGAIPFPLDALYEEFQRDVEVSLKDEVDKRRSRLRHADRKPNKRTVAVTVYDRNPDVVAERLFLSNGNCDRCAQPAPFMRASNGEPYLEVHHIGSLSAGGEDVVENTVALCPDCHREAHYG